MLRFENANNIIKIENYVWNPNKSAFTKHSNNIELMIEMLRFENVNNM